MTDMVAARLTAQIEDAPGQGIVPGVSLHLAGEAQLFRGRTTAAGRLAAAQPARVTTPTSR